MSFNPLWNTIFPSVDSVQAAKFSRLVTALDGNIYNLQEIGLHTPWNTADVVNLMNSIASLGGTDSWHAHQGRDNVIVSKYALSLTSTETTPAGERGMALALVDLPDTRCATDFYFMKNHYACCGGLTNDPFRQQQSDAIVNWMRDARSSGRTIDLPPGTPWK